MKKNRTNIFLIVLKYTSLLVRFSLQNSPVILSHLCGALPPSSLTQVTYVTNRILQKCQGNVTSKTKLQKTFWLPPCSPGLLALGKAGLHTVSTPKQLREKPKRKGNETCQQPTLHELAQPQPTTAML